MVDESAELEQGKRRGRLTKVLNWSSGSVRWRMEVICG